LAIKVPRKLLELGLVPCSYHVLRFYLSLLRLHVIGEEQTFRHVLAHGRVIVALWHQRFLPALAYVARFRQLKAYVMISKSRDGDLIAPIAERLGLEAVRGSSSKGGKEALETILRAYERRPAAVHIVDGPRGPKGVIKPGLIRLAQLSGASIVPAFLSAEKAWVLGSWDQFLVPKPFSKVHITLGKPFFVPKTAGSQEFEDLRKAIEDIMRQGYAEEDRKWGWKTPL
jgi:lysophospholipid acyltransferase (LPLAT)-like uncharacterized protein